MADTRHALTRAVAWAVQAVGMDDAAHHGVSFTKAILVFFSAVVGVKLLLEPGVPSMLVILAVCCICGAFGRPMMYRFLDMLKAKWSATSAESTQTTVALDAAAIITATKTPGPDPTPRVSHDA